MQIKIAEGLAKGLTKKEALVAAGISEANARSNSSELTNQPGVRAALETALKKANVGIDRIAGIVDDGLRAVRVISVDDPLVLFPDYQERRQMARLASELLDLFPAQRIEDVTPPVQNLPDEELNKRINTLLQSKVRK